MVSDFQEIFLLNRHSNQDIIEKVKKCWACYEMWKNLFNWITIRQLSDISDGFVTSECDVCEMKYIKLVTEHTNGKSSSILSFNMQYIALDIEFSSRASRTSILEINEIATVNSPDRLSTQGSLTFCCRFHFVIIVR